MTILPVDDVSIAFTSFFMKLIGFWLAANRSEQRLRDVTLFYTMFAILFALWVQTVDFYHSREDFGACLYNACNILSLTVPMFKILVLLVHKEKFFHLITYFERNFLHANYDKYEASVLASCKRQCTFFICIFIFFTEITVMSYIGTPIIANIGKNESERELPFDMWVDLPVTMTPYFEIFFTVEALCVYHIGLAYFCFDNILCILSLHLAGQFKILQYRLSGKYIVTHEKNSEKNCSKLLNDSYGTFKGYIRQHQTLIAFCNQLEEVFSPIVLVQVMAFSLIICLDGFQMLLANLPLRRLIFLFHFMATTCQLLMFSYSCDRIIRESMKLAPAVYSGPWLLLPISKNGQKIKKDLIMVIMRSNVPCCLTGSGFFMVSLETYTKVLTTAASYFTLLQQTQNTISSYKEMNAVMYSDHCYAALKKCIQHHQLLIEFCVKLEQVYTMTIFTHMTVLSLLLCFDSYEILVANTSASMRIIFLFHAIGSLGQLFMLTYTSNFMMEESTNVITSMYLGSWSTLPMNKVGRSFRSAMKFIMIRSLKPCYLTAAGFFPLTLGTFTSLLSSTFSYFTLMRQSFMRPDGE
ncbi:odorant receptor 13a-like [Osmia bicornis bicornis]|uniref:odorant receptor 13a-like n=1 Tax=Osmia bicornis bicornis TaxID=1437191 RepID=UPI001EAED055|nr:odorant receptor 13a-like [Osmia bicornis bicornis]